MGSRSRNIRPPRPGRSSRSRRGGSSKSRQSNRRNRVGEVAKTLSQSKKRSLKEAGITEDRLEILALSDFKPLFSAGQRTLAGEMFDLRVTKRNSDIEAVKITLDELEKTLPVEFAAAVAQYNSALTATEADIALIKIMILLKEYSTHTARFLSFVDEYSPAEIKEKFNIDYLGSSNNTFSLLENAGAYRISSTGGDKTKDLATLQLAQILVAVNACSSGMSPHFATKATIAQEAHDQINVGFQFQPRGVSQAHESFAFYIGKLSRDLTFSNEVVKIKNDTEADELFKELLIEKLGESWINARSAQNKTVISYFTGTSWSTSKIYKSETLLDASSRRQKSLYDFRNNRYAIGSLFYGSRTLPIESRKQDLKRSNGSSKQFDSIEPIVDEAFSGPKVLDFEEFNEVIDDITTQISNLVDFGKVGFRILDGVEDAGPSRAFPLADGQGPLSSVGIGSVCIDIFNRRFASTFGSAAYKKYTSWLSAEHVAYTRMMAWILLRKKPSLWRDTIDRFLDDYKAGFLTAAGQPAPIPGTAEVDSDGNEIPGTEQISAVQHVLPGTSTVVSLVGKSSRAQSSNWAIYNYFKDDVSRASPASLLSYNLNENVSEPGVRVNYDRVEADYPNLFGDTNNSRADDGDLRLVTPIGADKKYNDYIDGVSSEYNNYYGAKIIQAEIIDTYIEVLRVLVEPFLPVEAAAEGDPIFPFIEGEIVAPYTQSDWPWNGAGYEAFQIATWVPTLLAFKQAFLRDDDTTYLFERDLYHSRHITTAIVESLNALMKPLGMLDLKKDDLGNTPGIIEYTASAGHVSRQTFPIVAQIAIKGSSSPAGARRAARAGQTNSSIFSGRVNNDSVKNFFRDHLPSTISALLEVNSFPMASEPPPSGASARTNAAEAKSEESARVILRNSYVPLVNAMYQNDATMSFLYDFLEKYVERVDGYKSAVLDLVEGEGTALGELITNLRAAGPAGVDVLQNITPNQLSLKQIAVDEESGTERNGYLPNLSILKNSEINAVKTLCREKILKSPEGDTTKTIAVGIPAGTFDAAGIDSEFCLRVTYIDSEYPQLVFKSKSVKFDKDLYVLPDDFETGRGSSTFLNFVKSTTFSRLRVEVVETDDTSPVITINDDVKTERYNSRNPDIYTNLAVSEVLKTYYRIMVGVNFSENAFPSFPGGVNLEISDAAADLAGSLAGNVEEIANFSSGLAGNINDILGDITKFDDPDSFVSGEITPVDNALLSNLKNTYQTRVFSPEILRSRAISAKMFDRIYVLPIDPDEFYIEPPISGPPATSTSLTDTKTPTTPRDVFDFYLNAGVIEDTGVSGPKQYKLAPRRSAEGSMALGKVTVMLTTTGAQTERLLEI